MRILLAAGGTGGHLMPSIRIGEAIARKEVDSEMVFVGSDRGFEERVIGARGHRYVGLPARGLSRRRWWRNVPAVVNNLRARKQARRLVKDFAPDAAVGCGGYASYFPIRACARAGIPYIIQEQNSFPGLVTRWLAPGAARTFLAFDAARQHLPEAAKVRLTGNPVDPRLSVCDRPSARARWNLSDNETVVLITGGSAGAQSINDNVARSLRDANETLPLTLLWQTGRQWDGGAEQAAAGWRVHNFAFTDAMTEAMIAADLIISRSGALTVSEICAAGRPAILVPYPYAAADHQMQNARTLEGVGGAVIVEDRTLGEISLLDLAITLLTDGDRRQAMGTANRELARPQAADEIADFVIALAQSGAGAGAEG